MPDTTFIADQTISLTRLGQLSSGETELFTGGSEVVSTDGGMAYVTNGAQGRIDVFDIVSQTLTTSFDLTGIAHFDGVQSVAASGGLIAAAVSREGDDGEAMNGVVALFAADGTLLATHEVGNLPDMLTFTPDGQTLLVANEGEPTDEVNPAGSVSVLSGLDDPATATVTTLGFEGFNGTEEALLAQGVLLEPGVSVSLDVEPEYIAVSPDGTVAWVTLQEANAYAVLDLTTQTITEIRSFGLVDHSQPGNEIDASDRDGAINLQTYDNLFGMRQPDSITAFESNGMLYFVTANEGDARDHTESRVDDLDLDPDAFPNADALQEDEALGRLNVRTDLGDTDGDGDYDQLYAYGGRGFTIYDAAGNIVFDSGAMLSELIAEMRPDLFNHDDGEFDRRSDNKGIEPEAIAVGQVDGRTLLFVGLERDNGVVILDISDPASPAYVNYIDSETHGNISPETISFISADNSTSGQAEILIAYEGDGNTAIYALEDTRVQTGTEGADRLEGSELNDTLSGLDGMDTLIGLDGDDFLFGGSTEADLRDNIYGGNGNDVIDGGAGNDALRGDAGNDTIQGEAGADTVIGGAGDDVLSGNSISDLLFGGEGDDFINGGFGNDRANGGAGADVFFHLGVAGHGTDWVQDYDATEGDVLQFGGTAATRSQFQVNFAETANAGEAGVEEAFVIYRPTGQILWTLVDGAAQDEINILIGGTEYDLLA